MASKIGFKNTSFKSENYALQKLTDIPVENEKENVLMVLGYEKAQKILLKFLQKEIFPGAMIEELNQIRHHFFS